MKSEKGRIGAQLDRPDPAIRFYLLSGTDESGSRALAARLLAALGAEKMVMTGAQLRGDTAALADEACAISMFGGPRLIWIEPAGDEIAPAVEALLAAPAVECPVVAIAGALRKGTALLKLAEGAPGALSHISYVPDARDADRLVVAIGQAHGLRISPDVAGRVARAAANDQAVAAQEIAKFALFLDAAPERVRELDHDTLDALGADAAEGESGLAGDFALSGALSELAGELDRLESSGLEPIPLLRAMQRRLLSLAPMRARVDQGESVDAVMASMGKALFWKDKPVVSKILRSWSAARLAQASERLSLLERSLMLDPLPGNAALGEELIALARAARRR